MFSVMKDATTKIETILVSATNNNYLTLLFCPSPAFIVKRVCGKRIHHHLRSIAIMISFPFGVLALQVAHAKVWKKITVSNFVHGVSVKRVNQWLVTGSGLNHMCGYFFLFVIDVMIGVASSFFPFVRSFFVVAVPEMRMEMKQLISLR